MWHLERVGWCLMAAVLAAAGVFGHGAFSHGTIEFNVAANALTHWLSNTNVLLAPQPVEAAYFSCRGKRVPFIVEQWRSEREIMSPARIDEADVLAAARETHGLGRMDQIKYAVRGDQGRISIMPR